MMVEHDLQAMPGRWRLGPVFVSDTVSGDIVYEGPDSDLVPTLMDELVTRLTEGEGPTLARAAMAHLNLVMVHPHKDGNGRMARVLQSLVLAREGILAPEFCSIEEYLGRFTQEYYRMLADVGSGRWRPDRDATPWVRFCLTAHFRQARVLLARTREIGRLFEMIDEHLDAHDLPARAAAPLYLAVLGHRLTNVTYRAQADTTPNTASRDLRALVVAGLLAAHGEKRGRTYTATRRLAASWRDATVAVRQQDRLDPYLTDDATVDPYARPRLS